jgi:hypothetical protein
MEEIDDTFICEQTENFSTLDGFVFDYDQGRFSYDNDFDETLPPILIGTKNPNQEERKKQFTRKFRFPRKLIPLRSKNIKFWKEEKSLLSEILSAYPHLSARICGMGTRKANELLSLLVFLNQSGQCLQDLPLGEDLFEIIRKRCVANNYQGDWRLLSKLLQIENHIQVSDYWIKENFNQREISGNLVPKGKKLLESLVIRLTLFPVNKPKRKRGYSDKGSRKDPSKIHELSISNQEVKETRTLETLKGKNLLLNFLYGVSNPVKYIENETQSEIDYRKRINQDLNRIRRQEKKRIQSLTGEVITIKNKEKI